MRERRNLFLRSLRKEMWVLLNNQWHYTRESVNSNPYKNSIVTLDCGQRAYPYIVLIGRPDDDICEECKKVCNALTS